ncbi:MAG: hypothetical protein MR274_07535 [Clostridium sp.]|nr:hypothetical protein [Clostridium sp.]
MKKRVLSVILILSLVLVYVPHIVFAVGSEVALDISDGSIVITDDGAEQNGVNQTADIYRITGTTTSNTLTVNTSGTTNLIFDDLTITRTNESNMVEINSGYAKVTLVGVNQIGCRNPNRYASIYVAVDATIEFTSDSIGSLNVYNSTNSINGNNSSAAIGASHKNFALQGGTIIIKGGTITADAGYGSAGIGGGNGTNIQAIKISGGTITASSTSQGAGIGSGKQGTIDLLEITGGVVSATAQNSGKAIGTGQYGTLKTKNISGGIISENKGTTYTVYGDTVLTNSFELPSSSQLTVSIDCSLTVADGVTLTNSGNIINNGTITNKGTIENNGTIINNSLALNIGTFSGTGTMDGDTLKIPAKYLDENGEEQTAYCDVAITAENINEYTTLNSGWYVVKGSVLAGSRITVSGDVKLILADQSILDVKGGIGVPQGSHFQIFGQEGQTGSLKATDNLELRNCGIGGTGRGSYAGDITIHGGQITARAGLYSAAIGGAADGYGGNIIINDGTVTATGNESSAIGGGYNGICGNITINGGTVTANSSAWDAALGAGRQGYAPSDRINGKITITGGIVSADSIGSGYAGKSITVSIEGGVTIGKITDSATLLKEQGMLNNEIFGDFTLPIDWTVESGDSLYILENTFLTIPSEVTMTNNGKIYVDGTINGILNGPGEVYYPITIEDGTVSGDTSIYNSKNYGKVGAKIALSYNAPPLGQSFGEWITSPTVTISDSDTFIMPNEALTITAQYINTPTYTVTIPATVDFDKDIEISATGVNVISGSQLEIKLTNTSDATNGFILENSYGEKIEYEIINSATNGIVALNDKILTVAGGVANNSAIQTFKLNQVTQKVKHSGIYEGTITFTISVEEVATTQTNEE